MSASKRNRPGRTPPVQYGVATLAPNEMLRLGAEFQRLREQGRKQVGRYLVLITAESADGTRRCGIICGKRYSPKAVARNRARRLLKEAYRLVKARIRPVWLGLIPRPAMAGQRLPAVQQDLMGQLQRAAAWIEEGGSP